MKLYLSSYRLGNETDKLVSMVPENKRTAVVFNALDFSNDFVSKQSTVDREINDLHSIGLEPEEFDLRLYFGSPEHLKEYISRFGLIWVTGGNTFVLRRAMSQSGLDQFLIANRNNDTLIYAGYSAGACVLSPTLRGIDLVDDPKIAPPGYKSDTIWEGLSLINFCIAPHYKSNHNESELINKTIEYFLENKILFKALRDGEVIVIE